MIHKFSWIMSIFCFTLLAKSVSAQDCTPDQSLTQPGTLPITLPSGEVDVDYNESITVMLFSDTMVSIQGQTVNAAIDSMVITDCLGLPDGFTYACKDNNCTFLPLTLSCITMKGKTSNGGMYPLEIPVIIYAKAFGFPLSQADTIRSYSLFIIGGTNNTAAIVNSNTRLLPNPAKDKVNVFTKNEPELFNSMGQRVFVNIIKENEGNYSILLNGIATGIYYVRTEEFSESLVVE